MSSHIRTDPACPAYQPPRFWWQWWLFDRARGRACPACRLSRADEHDEGRCDACETPGVYGLCCGDHQARMCSSCTDVNHGDAR